MGKIGDMQDNYNKVHNNKDKRLDTKGIKTLRLLKPGIEDEYPLTKNQKQYLRTLRAGAVVSIAALATAFSITAIANIVNSRSNYQTEMTYDTSTEVLDRDTVLGNAKATLENIIFSDENDDLYALVEFPTRDEHRNINSVRVSELVGQNYYSVYEYNISNKKYTENTPKIVNEFMKALLEVASDENPSQEALQNLNDLSVQINQMNLELDGKFIIDPTSKELDNEI